MLRQILSQNTLPSSPREIFFMFNCSLLVFRFVAVYRKNILTAGHQ